MHYTVYRFGPFTVSPAFGRVGQWYVSCSLTGANFRPDELFHTLGEAKTRARQLVAESETAAQNKGK